MLLFESCEKDVWASEDSTYRADRNKTQKYMGVKYSLPASGITFFYFLSHGHAVGSILWPLSCLAESCHRVGCAGLRHISLLGADSSDRHHSSCFALFGAVGKQQLWMTVGAKWRGLDVFPGYTGRQELLAIGFNEVEKDFGREFAVARSAGG